MTPHRAGTTTGPPATPATPAERADGDWFHDLFALDFARATRLAGLMGADDPEDIAQEAFARVHLRRARFDGADDAARYLNRVVCNLTHSRTRHLAVARRVLPRLASDAAPVDPGPGVDETDRVRRALAGLPRRQREVVVLRHWLGLDEAEIAETLGISAGSVKSHSHRARKALEQQLEPR